MNKLFTIVITIVVAVALIPIIISTINKSTTTDTEISTVVDFTTGTGGQNIEIDSDFYATRSLDNPLIIYLDTGNEIFTLTQTEHSIDSYSDSNYNILAFEETTGTVVKGSSFKDFDNVKIYYITQSDTVSPSVKILLNLIPILIVLSLLGTSFLVYKKSNV